jgi:hypothetical protein
VASYWGILGVASALEIGWGVAIDLIDEPEVYALGVGIVVGILYGIVGGRLYEFLKYRRVSKNPDLAMK